MEDRTAPVRDNYADYNGILRAFSVRKVKWVREQKSLNKLDCGLLCIVRISLLLHTIITTYN